MACRKEYHLISCIAAQRDTVPRLHDYIANWRCQPQSQADNTRTYSRARHRSTSQPRSSQHDWIRAPVFPLREYSAQFKNDEDEKSNGGVNINPVRCLQVLWTILQIQASIMSGWHIPILVSSDRHPQRCLAAANLDPERVVCSIFGSRASCCAFDPRSPYTDNPSISRSTNHANPLSGVVESLFA